MKIESKGSIYDCFIDKDDYEKIKDFNWRIGRKGYVSGWVKDREIFLHRFILNEPKGYDVDHFNHNILDNRKSNFKIVTHQQNLFNTRSKGIYWDKSRKKWVAQIHYNYKRIYLGGYNTEEEAKEARRQAEIKYFGEFRYKD